jgi:hypothetical protein
MGIGYIGALWLEAARSTSSFPELANGCTSPVKVELGFPG